MNKYVLNQIPYNRHDILNCYLAFDGDGLKLRHFKISLSYHSAVMLHGGDSLKLIKALYQIDFARWAEGKEIWAYSAGISALTYMSYNQDTDVIIHGLGLLNFKSIVHYNDRTDRRKLDKLMKTAPNNMPVLLFSNQCEMEVIA
jgi:hypothetical protein